MKLTSSQRKPLNLLQISIENHSNTKVLYVCMHVFEPIKCEKCGKVVASAGAYIFSYLFQERFRKIFIMFSSALGTSFQSLHRTIFSVLMNLSIF